MSNAIDAVHDRVTKEAREYAPGEQRPLWGYVRVMSAYAAGVAGLSALVVARRRPLPLRPATSDVILVSLATAKAARLMTRDIVTSPLRAPFTSFEGHGGPAEVNEQPRGSGLQRSIGELVSCPFCMSQWIATGFGFGLLLAPRVTRQVAATFAALEIADILQFGRAAIAKADG